MRQEWINKRAQQYYAQHPHLGVAYIKAHADAAREWPLYREHQYDGDKFDCDPIYRARDGAWRA